MIKKIDNYNSKQGIETITQSTRGGLAYSPSGSSGGFIKAVRAARVDTKWINVTGAFTGSNLNGFTHSDGVLTYTGGATKTFQVYGSLSFQTDANTYLNMAVAKNGAILSESHNVIWASASLTPSDTLYKVPTQQLFAGTRVSLATNDTIGLQYVNTVQTLAVITASTVQLVVHQ